MFRFTQEPSSVSRSQCLAQITGMVPLYLLICALPVLLRHIPTCCDCVRLAVQKGVQYLPAHRATHIATNIAMTTHISTNTVEPYL